MEEQPKSLSEFDPMKEAGTGKDESQGNVATTYDSDSNKDSLEDFEKVDAEQLRQIDQLDLQQQETMPKTIGEAEMPGVTAGPEVEADPLLPPFSEAVKSNTDSSLLELDPFGPGYQREKETSLLELAPESEIAPEQAAAPTAGATTFSLQEFDQFDPCKPVVATNINQSQEAPKIDNISSDLSSGKATETPAGLPYELSYKSDPSPIAEEIIPSNQTSSSPRELSPAPPPPPVETISQINEQILELKESTPQPKEPTPPPKATPPPREPTPPPKEPTPPPREPTPPPREPTPPPKEPTPPPREPTPPPREPTPPPKEPTPPLREPTPPPREPTPPPKEPTPPPREPTPPPREPTPPPKEPTPPPREPTPPPREPTPPPRELTPPPREPTPPPREPTPPPKEPTPPPREPTPPPREPTPPPREPTPPPREPTPPPREPTPPPREPTPPRQVSAESFVKSAFPGVELTAGAGLCESSRQPVQEAVITEGPPAASVTSRKVYQSATESKVFEPIVNLIYWRDVKKSGIVFGSIMVILLSLAYLSLISVVAYTSLTVLTGTIAFRIYKNIMQAIQKSQDGHPFKQYLELDTSLQSDKVHEATDIFVSQINSTVSELKRLFLVEDLIDSVKFGCLLWCLTYVGSWFNGLTLVILSVVALFSLPKVYEQNQAQIDQYFGLVRTHFNDIVSKVKAAIPIGNKESKEKEQ